MEGQTSGDTTDPEVWISSIRAAASDQGCVCVQERVPSLKQTVAISCCCVY